LTKKYNSRKKIDRRQKPEGKIIIIVDFEKKSLGR